MVRNKPSKKYSESRAHLKRRERLVAREQATFSGSAGTTQGALARERAGGI
jgi:hypothetical protein